MGKLAGFLSSGIGLAIEAAAEYQSSNKTAGKRTSSHYQQDLNPGPRDVCPDQHQNQRDAKAFQELQSYADFQRVLSNRVQDDILRDDNYTPIDPQILPQGQGFGDYFSHKPYLHPSIQKNSQGRLLCPVIIPQRRPEDKSRGWVRAYAPALMDCGIDQYTFLNFLDAFNESSKSSPYLNAVNVAGFGVGFAPGITPMLISMAVPIAVKVAKTKQTDNKTTSFLTRANKDLFAPHGLFAMVMTYKPITAADTYTMDTSQPAPQDMTPTNEPQLPTGAPLIFPESDHGATASQQGKFKKMGHFIADYGDRRAQARYAYEHPESTLTTPAPTFRSRWGDPNNPANSGGLSLLITGRPRDRDDKQKDNRERRRRSSSSSSSSSSKNSSDEKEKRPGLIKKGVRSMVNGPGKEDQSLRTGLKGMGMKKDVLYLMIVNAPTSPTSSEPMSYDSSLVSGQLAYPYREAKRIKSPPAVLEPDPFQRQGVWTPDSGVVWLPNERFEPPRGYQSAPGSRGSSRGRSPPPAYESSQRGGGGGRYDRKRREEEYCVPTL